MKLIEDLYRLSEYTLAQNNDSGIFSISSLEILATPSETSMDMESQGEAQVVAKAKQLFTDILKVVERHHQAQTKFLESATDEHVRQEVQTVRNEYETLRKRHTSVLKVNKEKDERILELEQRLGRDEEGLANLLSEKKHYLYIIQQQEKDLKRLQGKLEHMESDSVLKMEPLNSSNSSMKQDSPTEPNQSNNKEHIPDDRDDQIKDLKQSLEIRRQEIETLRKEQKQIIESKERESHHSSEEDIENNFVYVHLNEKLKSMMHDLNREKEKNEKLAQDYHKLLELYAKEKDDLKKEYARQGSALQNAHDNATKKFKDMESDRDKIKFKYEQLKAKLHALGSPVDIENLKQLFETRLQDKDKEISLLKEHIQQLSQQFDEHRKKWASSESMESKATSEILALTDTVNNQSKQMDALAAEIDEIAKEYDTLLVKFSEAEKKNKEQEDLRGTMTEEKIKFNATISQLKKEKAILAEKINTLESKLQVQKGLLEEYSERQKIHDEERKKLEEESILLKKVSSDSQMLSKESTFIVDLLRRQYEELNKRQKESLNDIVLLKTAAVDEQNKYLRLKEDHDLKEKQLDRYRSNHKGKDDELFEMYRTRYNCTLCNKARPIDSVIHTCNHTFCNQCIQDRLIKQRNRKCPTCKVAFGANDVHLLYFT